MAKITYDQLYAADLDIKRMKVQNPGMALLLQSRINVFYEKNKEHFAALDNGIKAIQKKFIVHDENGRMMMETVDGVQELQYVPVYTDLSTASIVANRAEIKRLFEDHVKKFTSLTINIEL
jgi:hypothetical protein